MVSAGGYPAAEARRAVRGRGMPPVVEIPPGVDLDRFVPLGEDERARARADLGLPADGPLVVSVSRLVPRKGMDVLIDAAALLAARYPDLTVAIAGRGRDAERLAGRVAEAGAPVRLLGGVSDADLPRLVGAADVFAMLCRNRWLGLEQEGFGIVFLEAAAAGVPQVAGASGGAGEAVEDGVTGVLVRRPTEAGDVARAIGGLLDDPAGPGRMGVAARRRAEASFDYDLLAPRLAASLGDTRRLTSCAGLQPTIRGGGPTVAEQATERMVVSADPARCFEVSADIASYPSWAADIKAVTIDERDAEGRPSVVTFRAAAFGRSTSYTLAYDYSEAPGVLAWVQTEGDITNKLDGRYVFAPDPRRRDRGHLPPRGRDEGAAARASSRCGPRAASCRSPSAT